MTVFCCLSFVTKRISFHFNYYYVFASRDLKQPKEMYVVLVPFMNQMTCKGEFDTKIDSTVSEFSK